jgi:hypothetical protein
MAGRRALITQADLTRCIKAAVAAGLPVASVDIRPDGSVRLFTIPPQDDDGPNPCDRLLK